MADDLLQTFISDPARYKVFLQEKAAVDISETICEVACKMGVTIDELAEAAGMGKTALITLLDQGTIDARKAAKLLFYLGHEIRFTAVPPQKPAP